jgi:hypothetical protein
MGEKVVKPSDMTREEFIARITKLVARNEKLEDELRESWEETVRFSGYRRTEGQYLGYWAHQCLSAVRVAMRDLVRTGHWEWYPGSDYYARPIEKDEQEEPTCQP